MIKIKSFAFNAFSENTYVVYDDSRCALLIDPGCNDGNEKKMLSDFIKKESLIVSHIINTHCHIDHVLGNKYCKDLYQVPLWIPEGEEALLAKMPQVASLYAVYAEASPPPDHLMTEGEELICGLTKWLFISTPGHSPASICLYAVLEHTIIGGDVLFYESIGRTDLPGGNHQQLLQNIRQKLFTLPDETIVYPGHGPTTTIGHEKKHNPFLNGQI